MNKDVINFAGNPIYVSRGNEIASTKELDHLRNINKIFIENNKTLKLSESSHIFKDKQLKNIEQILLNNFNDYKKDVLQINDSFYICNSWCTLQTKGGSHHNHVHPNAIFSAVYYAKAEKSVLIFYLDRSKLQENFHFSYEIKNYNIYNSCSWSVEVNAGDVIIFPGHLRHQSPVCEIDERIIVSSSFFVKGKLGDQNTYNDIYLNG